MERFVRVTNVRRLGALTAASVLALGLAACGSSNDTTTDSAEGAPSGGAASTDWAAAQSAEDGGGMDALVTAAKAEGTLNTIALPDTWANYAAIKKAFTAKYGIKIHDENPDGSSGDEINALKSTKGQDSAPDVVDIGNSYALSGALEGDFAAYKVATWDDIPEGQKDEGGLWFSDYGGYISIGCDAAKISVPCPTTIAELDNPKLKGKVALNGDPTTANAAFNGVWAAALANGGSATDIQPGIDFFKKLNDEGIFNKTQVSPETVASGATPVVLDWDYLNVGNTAALKKSGVTWTTTVPADGLVSGYYAQAVNADAPHPAAARLWEEFLYSQDADGGQNLWLQGAARPIELVAMEANGSADKAADAALPKVDDSNPFLPTEDQITKAKDAVTKNWSAAIS